MKRLLTVVALLALAACHRQGTADVTLDADADARNATAARTLDVIAAADAAVQGPAPQAGPIHGPQAEKRSPEADDDADRNDMSIDDNGADTPQ